MGGRIATHLASQRLESLSGVVCFGYPLHPPGKPEQLRVAHLPSIMVPVLVIQGERDAFGTPAELKPHFEEMQAAVTLRVIARGDHSLAVRGRPPSDTYAELADFAAAFIAPTAK
jgi:predicted alpha/beta-hydrolase family hydrolase